MTNIRAKPESTPPRRRSDGERSRNAILREAGQLATVEGISGLSIGRLAEAVGMSKSGLFAHFGSKEELQVATIEMARAEFIERVIEPASVAPTGLERVRQLAESFLRYVEAGVYPGGCFSCRSLPRWLCDQARCVTARLRSWTNFLGSSREPFATPKPRARSILRRMPSSSPSNSAPTCHSPTRSSRSARNRHQLIGLAARWKAGSRQRLPPRGRFGAAAQPTWPACSTLRSATS